MSAAIRPGAAEHATQLVIDWIAGDYPAMSADFNAEVSTPAGTIATCTCAAAWRTDSGTLST